MLFRLRFLVFMNIFELFRFMFAMLFTKKRLPMLFYVFLVATICFIGYYQLDNLFFIGSDNQNLNHSQNVEIVKNNLKETKICVIQTIKQQTLGIWFNLHKIITNCSVFYGAVKRPFIEASIDKHFIPYSKNTSGQECNVVSLGIGNEIVLEERLKSMQPFCKFYGADPFLETAEVYKKVGKVFITAIDAESGERVLSVLKDGKYSWNKVKTTSFGSFLKNDLHIKKVHILSMDIEGAEYRLLPYMTSSGAFQVESDSTIVCQIIAEIHGSLKKHNYTELMFQEFILNFVSSSPYVPIKGMKPDDGHYVVFMNLEEEYCLKLFY